MFTPGNAITKSRKCGVPGVLAKRTQLHSTKDGVFAFLQSRDHLDVPGRIPHKLTTGPVAGNLQESLILGGLASGAADTLDSRKRGGVPLATTGAKGSRILA